MKVEIRKWRMEDAADLAAAMNNQKVQDNLRDGIPYPYTEEDARSFIGSALKEEEGRYLWAIAADGRAVGSIGIYRKENIHSRTAEAGYYLAEPWWGKGIGTAALKEACAHIFQNTDILRIFAEPFSDNAASCRILEKAGFTLEGTLKSNAVKNGRVRDMKMYALVREEPEKTL